MDSKITAGKSGGFEFTNSVSKEEEGIRLQVGANREQMIGLSVGNMRSRELGLGGIDVIGVGNAEEAIERIDEAISRVPRKYLYNKNIYDIFSSCTFIIIFAIMPTAMGNIISTRARIRIPSDL